MLKNYVKGLLKDVFVEYMYDSKDPRLSDIERKQNYRNGVHDKPLKIKSGVDDNITVNFTGLLVDRSVSMLIGAGVTFDPDGEGETDEGDYIDSVWDANKRIDLQLNLADYGAISGTPAVKIRPGVHGDLPALEVIDPETLEIITDPFDIDHVISYSIVNVVSVIDERGETSKRRRQQIIIEQPESEEGAEQHWLIHDYLQNDKGKMVEMKGSPTLWEYPFPPVIDWKNLPNAGSQYGRADLTDDIISVQDAINRTLSNANKVMRLQAHQRLWGRMLGSFKALDWGPDKMMNSQSPDASIGVVEAGGDLVGMREFALLLRDSLFSIGRSADPAVIKDSVGEMTNFGLSILYKDALDKLETKRGLYGDAFSELNRRLLILNGMDGEKVGEVVWDNPLPIDSVEQSTALLADLNHGVVSKETVRQRSGYDNEQENKRLAAEKTDVANIGGLILENFNKGQL